MRRGGGRWLRGCRGRAATRDLVDLDLVTDGVRGVARVAGQRVGELARAVQAERVTDVVRQTCVVVRRRVVDESRGLTAFARDGVGGSRRARAVIGHDEQVGVAADDLGHTDDRLVRVAGRESEVAPRTGGIRRRVLGRATDLVRDHPAVPDVRGVELGCVGLER